MVGGPAPSSEIQKNFQALMSSYPDWRTFSAKGTADLALGFGTSLGASTQVRMIRGEALEVSVRIILGIEAARFYMDTERAVFINKLQRQYVTVSLSELSDRLGVRLSLKTVQDILLGRIFLLNATSGGYSLSDFKVAEGVSGAWSLSPVRQDSRFTYGFELNDIRLMRSTLLSSGGDKKVVCNYADFMKQGASSNFPTTMQVDLSGLSRPLSIKLKYDTSSVSWNGSMSVESPDMSKYTQVSAEALIKGFSL